jgi:hypothetical protein
MKNSNLRRPFKFDTLKLKKQSSLEDKKRLIERVSYVDIRVLGRKLKNCSGGLFQYTILRNK